jgi:hypothetical protein
MKNFNKLMINNIDAIKSICFQKSISLETLSNYLFDQYIIYYNESIKSMSADNIEPQSEGMRESKIVSFKRFIDTYPITKGKVR